MEGTMPLVPLVVPLAGGLLVLLLPGASCWCQLLVPAAGASCWC